MRKIALSILLTSLLGTVQAKEVGSFKNELGGITIFTDTTCKVSSSMLGGYVNDKRGQMFYFCWAKWEIDEVIIIFPDDRKAYFVPQNKIMRNIKNVS